MTDFDRLCRRLFFSIFIILMGGATIFFFAGPVLTPLAICLLPTDTAEAHYTSDVTLVEYRLNSSEQLFHSQIAYAGHTTTLLTTSPPTPPVSLTKQYAQMRMDAAFAKAGLRPAESEAPPEPVEPVFNVRFVRAFPSMVVRDLPDASLWRYYTDTWRARDFGSFLVLSFLTTGAAYLFYRHLRSSRRGYQR